MRFWLETMRIGPDIPLTHWMLHFPELGRWLALRKMSKFGNESVIRPFSYLIETHHIEIGDRVVIRPNTMLMADKHARIFIGNDVLIGAGVHVYVNNHRFDQVGIPIALQGYYSSKDVIIEDNVWIGANSIILAGVRVGTHSVIAAGSVVTGPVESFAVYAGVPARKIKGIINK